MAAVDVEVFGGMAESRYERSRFELVADPEDVYYRHHSIDMVVLAYSKVAVRGPVSHVAVAKEFVEN